MQNILDIDAPALATHLSEFIAGLVARKQAHGVVLGLSGGVDSAVLAALSARGLSPGHVHTFYLADRSNAPRSREQARLVADRLGLLLTEVDISSLTAPAGIPAILAQKISGISGTLNRLGARAYENLTGETPYAAHLRHGAGYITPGTMRHFFTRRLINPVVHSFELKHRVRRRIIEDAGRRHRWLPLSAANRTEFLLGWFIPDGIDDLFCEPLLGLYKTQVFRLAEFLDLPAEVVSAPPSPDMLPGITDELALGCSYTHLDLILAALEQGLTPEALDLQPRDIRSVLALHNLSAWRRINAHEPLPDNCRAPGVPD